MSRTVTLWRPVGPAELALIEESGSGFVTRFEVLKHFLASYRVEDAGGRAHREYWIPAEDLPAFNAAIVRPIEVVRRFP